MNFINLALNNVKKNFKNYAMYLISAIFSVMVFYIFCSIAVNELFVKLADNKAIIRVMFQISAFVVVIFSLMFIQYSNSFFLKTRKKEIAIYSMVGMEKMQIGRMLFYENLVIGFLAILCGIFLGIMFSKYFSLMLITMMKEYVDIKFAIIPKACVITILVFFIIFLLNSIHSYRVIYRYKLIELLAAQKKGEKMPKASVFKSIIAIVLIALGYVLPQNKTSMQLLKLAIPIIILVSIGTYLLFNNLIVIVIKSFKKNKNVYYKGVNMISTSNILYRAKINAKTLSIIALMSAATLAAMGSTYSFYKTTEQDLYKNIPFSYQFVNLNADLNKKVKDTISRYNNKLLSENNIKSINADCYIPIFNQNSFGGKVMSSSDYNNIVKTQNRGKEISLKDNECLFIETNQGDGLDRYYIKSKAQIKVNDFKMDFIIIKSTDVQVISPSIARGTLVVSDSSFKKIENKNSDKIINIDGYTVQNVEKSKELTEELKSIIPKEFFISSYYDVYQGYYKSGSVMIFIGMFLGVLFFLATGSIISFKQLIEASDDEKRYKILRNIGVSKREIKKSISKQLLITFGMPLIIAICHSIVALMINEKLMREKTMGYCASIILIYVLMYFVYYRVTVNSYTNIVCKDIS